MEFFEEMTKEINEGRAVYIAFQDISKAMIPVVGWPRRLRCMEFIVTWHFGFRTDLPIED